MNRSHLLSGIKDKSNITMPYRAVHLAGPPHAATLHLVHRDYPFLRFSELLSFELPYGINDKEWLSKEDLDVAESGLDSL